MEKAVPELMMLLNRDWYNKNIYFGLYKLKLHLL